MCCKLATNQWGCFFVDTLFTKILLKNHKQVTILIVNKVKTTSALSSSTGVLLIINLKGIRMKKFASVLALGMVAAMAAPAAMASDYYVGANLSHTVASKVDGATQKVDQGYSLVAGYNLTPSVAVEVGYDRLGDIKFGSDVVKGDAYTLAAAYKPGLSAFGFDAYGKVGIAQAQFKEGSAKWKGESGFVAVGADYSLANVTKGLSANVEAKLYNDFAREDVRVHALSAGLKYNF